MDNQEYSIILFPDFEKLQQEVKRLKTELSMRLLCRDELALVVCRNIESAYYVKLGALEHKVLKAQWSALRLKRKIELIRAKLNRQEKVVIALIDKVLDEEFAEFQQKLNQQIDKINEALKYDKAEFLSKEDNDRLKKMYHNVVKKLHPDLNPKATPEEARLFESAVEAYKNGDLKSLSIICEVLETVDPEPKETDAMNVLVRERERLEDLLLVIDKSIEDIKSKYPYTLKEYVEDEEKESQRRAELESLLAQYNEAIDIYKEKLREMME